MQEQAVAVAVRDWGVFDTLATALYAGKLGKGALEHRKMETIDPSIRIINRLF